MVVQNLAPAAVAMTGAEAAYVRYARVSRDSLLHVVQQYCDDEWGGDVLSCIARHRHDPAWRQLLTSRVVAQRGGTAKKLRLAMRLWALQTVVPAETLQEVMQPQQEHLLRLPTDEHIRALAVETVEQRLSAVAVARRVDDILGRRGRNPTARLRIVLGVMRLVSEKNPTDVLASVRGQTPAELQQWGRALAALTRARNLAAVVAEAEEAEPGLPNGLHGAAAESFLAEFNMEAHARADRHE